MSERDRMAGVLPADVAAELTRQSRAGATGTLVVAGDPGGQLRLTDGRVTAVESPGAPGVEALLLRSGRVLEASWVAAHQAGAARGQVAAELVRRGLIGATELETLCLMAAYDAAFAIAAGTVEGGVWDPAPGGHRDCWTAAVVVVDSDRLRAEAERRLAALAELPVPLRPGRDRLGVEPAPPGAPGARRPPTGLRRDVLGLADGRRTARDIAFLLGRGLYPVTVEAARLLTEGLIRIEAPDRSGGEVRALLAPRRIVAATPAAPAAPSGAGGAAGPAGPAELPQRQARASGDR